jgi:hypothetical protein
MNDFIAFLDDLAVGSRSADAVVAEFLNALSPLDPAKIAALANRSDHPDVSTSDVEAFFQGLEEAHISVKDFATSILARRLARPAKKTWKDRLAGGFWSVLGALFPLLLVMVFAFLGEAFKSIQWKTALKFIGISAGSTAVIDLLIWGLSAALTSGGSSTVHSHEWRVATSGGQPGARWGPATRRDVYNHYHGYHSWEESRSRIRRTCGVLAVVMVFACPLLGISFLYDWGVRGVMPIVGYLLVYPVLPVLVIGGLAYWVVKTAPPVRYS